jgi:hypothetical protein
MEKIDQRAIKGVTSSIWSKVIAVTNIKNYCLTLRRFLSPRETRRRLTLIAHFE